MAKFLSQFTYQRALLGLRKSQSSTGVLTHLLSYRVEVILELWISIDLSANVMKDTHDLILVVMHPKRCNYVELLSYFAKTTLMCEVRYSPEH